MFRTADMLESGTAFWDTLMQYHRLPFQCVPGQTSATLADLATGMALVLVTTDDDGERRVMVQVRDIDADTLLLHVLMNEGFGFLSGHEQNQALDELGAIDTLLMYAPVMLGEWEPVQQDLQEEEEQHG